MSNSQVSDKPCVYEIRVKGCLDPKWSHWFDGLSISSLANDESSLTGFVADQAALHGLLAKIRDLGLPLLSITQLESEERE